VRPFAAACLVALAWSAGARAPQQRESANPRQRQIIATVIDARTGRPVTGLPAEAFAVREDTGDREVIRAEPATDLMSVILMADTTTVFAPFDRDLRVTALSFFRTFMGAHPGSFGALWEFGRAGRPVQTFTSSLPLLEQATTRLFPQPDAPSNLLEAVWDGARELARQQHLRRAIVSFNSDAAIEASTMPGLKVEQALEAANATWFAVSLHPVASSANMRDSVMERLVPYSGGMRVTIVDIAGLEAAVTRMAELLASQYVVTYVRPSGATARYVAVGVRRDGLKVMAPVWAPK
jgi:hypothetical protein